MPVTGRFAPKAALGRLEIPLPLCPRKQTRLGNRGMSVSCHERTHAPLQTASPFDHLVGSSKQWGRHGETERLEVDGRLGLRRRLHPSGFALRKPPTTGSR